MGSVQTSASALRGRRFGRISVTAVALVLFALTMTPMYWMISGSVKSEREVVTMQVFPSEFQFENYTTVVRGIPLLRWFLNSIVVSGLATATTIMLALFAGYSLGRLRFPGRHFLFMLTLSGFMIPIHAIMIPLFLMLRNMGLANSYGGLILPLVVHPVSVLILTQFFRAVDKDFEDAARVEGAGEFRLLFQIMTPMAVPAIAAASVFIFQYTWNEFLWPLLIAQSPGMYTLPVGLATFAGGDLNVRFGPVMAASVIASLPVFLVYLLMQKYLAAGIAIESK